MKRLALAVIVALLARAAIAGALDDAQTALADRRYAEAAAMLEKAKVEANDYRLYLLANAYLLDGKHDKAIAALDALLAKYPKSSWRPKAFFKRADALFRMGRFADAEKVYEQQVAGLASNERRGQIARVYLTHADQAFDPKHHGERPGAEKLEDRKPDYKAALKLYQRAQELDALPDDTDRIALRIGLCHHHLKEHDAAVKQLATFLDKHPKSKLVPEALFHQGKAYAAKGDPDRARASFEKLLRDHQDGERVPEARYELAHTYGLPKPRSEGDLNLGARALRQLVTLHPAHELAPKAGYEIGLSYHAFGQHQKAIEELAAFVKAFARRKDAVEVGKAAYLIGQAHRSLNQFEEAVEAWQRYLRDFPAHENWQKAQAAIVAARYDRAAWLFRKKQWKAATEAFQAFAADYPLDGRNPQALYMLGWVPYKQEQWQEAVTAWRRVIAKFPRHRMGYAAQLYVADTLDRKLKAFEQAIEEYKKITQGPHKAAAERRLHELREPHLLVTYEKIHHTDAKPTLKVATRNVEKLHVKAYRLNAEDYFRRMGGLERIESLDIALIDPHDEWDVDVEGYKKYEDVESQIPLKLDGPGLFAVNLSTEKLEATAMVLVTDLAVLVKSSKKDVFVFAQNLRTGKPQPGARLLVSDGKKVVLEGTTGKDGVYQGSSDDLEEVGRARVYAVADGSPASNALDLSGLGVALGLQPRGLLYTDRPAYRPGETVRYRGLIRLVEQGSYAVGEGTEATVRVHSARGGLVHEATHKLSPFGTLAGEFALNAREPLGDCRIVATIAREGEEKKHTFTGQFKVDEYQLPLYKLTFDLAKPTFFRGEPITGTIRVEYFFGHPVPGKDVRFRLKDQRWETKTTDDKGEVAFEFETDFFRQTEILPLVAVLPAEGIAGQQNVLLVTQAYLATVSTLRDTFLVGEPFDAKVKTTEPAGLTRPGADAEAVAREVTVGLYRFVGDEAGEALPDAVAAAKAQGAPKGYVTVATETVTTAKETGEAVARLTAKEGGRHLIRVEGRDRKDNLVVAERRVFISGEDDKIKLRILADSDEYRVGETPEINVVCRVGPALALLTWEAERIYQYKLVPLRKGSNRIEVEIPDACAPNFSLQAAVLHDNEFHIATKALAVLKMLKVALEPAKTELAPGEEVTVKITTTDQAGKPVEAELSLAVVDEALYARYRDALPKLADLFHQRRTGRFYMSGASNGFKYAAVTRATSDALRRERERLADAPPPGPAIAGFAVASGPSSRAGNEGGGAVQVLLEPQVDEALTEDAVTWTASFNGGVVQRWGYGGGGGRGQMPAAARQQLGSYFQTHGRGQQGGEQSFAFAGFVNANGDGFNGNGLLLGANGQAIVAGGLVNTLAARGARHSSASATTSPRPPTGTLLSSPTRRAGAPPPSSCPTPPPAGGSSHAASPPGISSARRRHASSPGSPSPSSSPFPRPSPLATGRPSRPPSATSRARTPRPPSSSPPPSPARPTPRSSTARLARARSTRSSCPSRPWPATRPS